MKSIIIFELLLLLFTGSFAQEPPKNASKIIIIFNQPDSNALNNTLKVLTLQECVIDQVFYETNIIKFTKSNDIFSINCNAVVITDNTRVNKVMIYGNFHWDSPIIGDGKIQNIGGKGSVYKKTFNYMNEIAKGFDNCSIKYE